jgi:hypothetical protein
MTSFGAFDEEDANGVVEGYLEKRTTHLRIWKQRHFHFCKTTRTLTWFQKGNQLPNGALVIVKAEAGHGGNILAASRNKRRKYDFRVTGVGKRHRSITIFLRAESSDVMERWMDLFSPVPRRRESLDNLVEQLPMMRTDQGSFEFSSPAPSPELTIRKQVTGSPCDVIPEDRPNEVRVVNVKPVPVFGRGESMIEGQTDEHETSQSKAELNILQQIEEFTAVNSPECDSDCNAELAAALRESALREEGADSPSTVASESGSDVSFSSLDASTTSLSTSLSSPSTTSLSSSPTITSFSSPPMFASSPHASSRLEQPQFRKSESESRWERGENLKTDTPADLQNGVLTEPVDEGASINAATSNAATSNVATSNVATCNVATCNVATQTPERESAGPHDGSGVYFQYAMMALGVAVTVAMVWRRARGAPQQLHQLQQLHRRATRRPGVVLKYI